MPRGGKREGAGRKSKRHEENLAAKLSQFDELAFNALRFRLEQNDLKAVQIFFAYRFGLPTQTQIVKNEETVRVIEGKKHDLNEWSTNDNNNE